MNDVSEEGYSASRINEIIYHITTDGILLQQPNLVLIHAGTNDNDRETPEESYRDAPKRLGNLMDAVLCQCPDAVLLVAMLVHNDHNQTQTQFFNAQVPGLVQERYDKGFKVQVVNQTGVEGFLMADPLHPNDAGYRVMAQNFMDAINDLPSGWVSQPSDLAAAGANASMTNTCAVYVPYSTGTSNPTNAASTTPAATSNAAAPTTSKSEANLEIALGSTARIASVAPVIFLILKQMCALDLQVHL